MTQAQRHAEETRVKRMVEAAAKIASKAGKMPGGLERFIKELLTPEVDWREALATWAVELAKNDYTYSRPNKRYIRYGLYMPAMRSEELSTLVLIVDSSSSMDSERLNRVFTEGHAMLSTINCNKMIVLYVSTRVKGMQEFEAGDDPKALGDIEFGRGGTDFRPGFEWIAENEIEPCGVIYLTDGECNDYPEEEPPYPVLWGRTIQQYYFKDRFEPPFGEVIDIRA
jgi:predicted metal-dependent peptidase